LYSSQDFVRANNLMKVRWAWHVTPIMEVINAYKILARKSEEKNHLENLSLGGGIIFKLIFKE